MLLFLIPADVRRALMFLPYRLQSSRGVVFRAHGLKCGQAAPLGLSHRSRGEPAVTLVDPVIHPEISCGQIGERLVIIPDVSTLDLHPPETAFSRFVLHGL